MRVTQILAMLELAPEIREYVRQLPPGTPERLVTERRLRALTGMTPGEQMKKARDVVPGFRGFAIQRESRSAQASA